MRGIELESIFLSYDGHPVLRDISWKVKEGENWVVYGPNGSGKSLLGRIFAGRLQPSRGTASAEDWKGYPESVGYMSFELQKQVLEDERRTDETWFLHGNQDPGRSPLDLFSAGPPGDPVLLEHLISLFEIEHLLGRGLKFLSTGEFRKVLLVDALRKGVSLMVLDEPFDGLDDASRTQLGRLINTLAAEGTQFVVIVGRYSEVPGCTDNIIVLGGGEVRYCGALSGMPAILRGSAKAPPPEKSAGLTPVSDPGPDTVTAEDGGEPGREVLRLEHVSVRFGEQRIITDMNWTVRWGENWMVHGPNGAGKSTLLAMVNGDSTKVYGQNFAFLGRRRGSGESVWDIKKLIGFVSGDLHFSYSVYASVEEVILSGFHDSIGLYRECSGYEKQLAAEWMEWIGLKTRRTERFSCLSFGEQRLVLIARAMIKQPLLLIADEPCQGLDDRHRSDVLDLLDRIAGSGTALILYVTHDPAETLRSVTNRLEFVPHPGGGYTGAVTSEISSPS